MTSKFNDLVRIASGSSGNGVFSYRTADTKDVVLAQGYFNSALSVLAVGDIILLIGGIGGTVYHASIGVTANDGTNVSVTQSGFVEQVFQKISSKGSDAEVFEYVPSFAGMIANLRGILNAALATADATATLAINGVNVTTGVLTLTQAASAQGSRFTVTPTALNTFAAGDKITLTVGGGSTATGTFNATLKMLST